MMSSVPEPSMSFSVLCNYVTIIVVMPLSHFCDLCKCYI